MLDFYQYTLICEKKKALGCLMEHIQETFEFMAGKHRIVISDYCRYTSTLGGIGP